MRTGIKRSGVTGAIFGAFFINFILGCGKTDPDSKSQHQPAPDEVEAQPPRPQDDAGDDIETIPGYLTSEEIPTDLLKEIQADRSTQLVFPKGTFDTAVRAHFLHYQGALGIPDGIEPLAEPLEIRLTDDEDNLLSADAILPYRIRFSLPSDNLNQDIVHVLVVDSPGGDDQTRHIIQNSDLNIQTLETELMFSAYFTTTHVVAIPVSIASLSNAVGFADVPKPQDVELEALASKTSVKLRWSAPLEPNVDGLIVSWLEGQKPPADCVEGNIHRIPNEALTTGEHDVDDLNPGTVYSFRVCSVTSEGVSSTGVTVSFMTPMALGELQP